MKARISFPLAIAMALSILPFAGCTQQVAQTSPLISSAKAEPAVVAADTNVSQQAATVSEAKSPEGATTPEVATESSAPTAAAASAPPEPAPTVERIVPATIRPHSPALDVVKMAQAGVADSVMLTFITNTSSMFLLTSDEIIYLNDLGVPSEVVNAMMQRDQLTRQFWGSAQPVAAPATVAAAPTAVSDAQAAAPSYVNPPQPEPQPAAAAPAEPTVVNHNYFNETLSPYGTWVEIEGYGRCWQPTVVVVNRDWRPYSDGGRWVYTDAGWYWLSDYSWGATTFHYGRWFNHARWGWCWWPDTVWGPSWVSFRYSGDYCGWAPLPPHAYYRSGLGFSYHGRSVGFAFDFGLSSSCYTFVSWNRFCDSRPWHHRARPHEVTRIYNNTTIVNNYVTGDNNTVINRGIGPDRVRDLGRTEVKTVKLRDEGVSRSAGGRRERLDHDGRTLVVNRPLSPIQRETKSDGSRPERPALAAPARSEGGSLNTAQATRRERPETVRTTPAPVPATVLGSPTAPSKSEGGVSRDRERFGTRNQRSTTTAPVIVNGAQPSAKPAQPARPAPFAPVAQPATPAPVATPAQVKAQSPAPIARPSRPQPSSVIVVGKSQAGESSGQRAFPVYSSPQAPSRPVRPETVTSRPQAQTPTPTAPSASTRIVTPPAPIRQENQRTTRNFSQPSPSRNERPVYSAPLPVAPTSRPAPVASPRVAAPTPARSYSPPAVSTPRPAPAVSSPAYTPRPAPTAPAVSAPRSAPTESRSSAPSGGRPSAPSGSRSESGRRER